MQVLVIHRLSAKVSRSSAPFEDIQDFRGPPNFSPRFGPWGPVLPPRASGASEADGVCLATRTVRLCRRFRQPKTQTLQWNACVFGVHGHPFRAPSKEKPSKENQRRTVSNDRLVVRRCGNDMCMSCTDFPHHPAEGWGLQQEAIHHHPPNQLRKKHPGRNTEPPNQLV